MYYNPKPNPKRDLQIDVQSHLSIDLTEVNDTLTIKDTGDIITDNGIDSTERIVGIVRDNFQAVKAEQGYFNAVLEREQTGQPS